MFSVPGERCSLVHSLGFVLQEQPLGHRDSPVPDLRGAWAFSSLMGSSSASVQARGGTRSEGTSCWEYWEEQMSAVQAQPPGRVLKGGKREIWKIFGFKLQQCPQACDVLQVIRPWCWGKRGHHRVSSWPRGLQVVLALPGSPQMPPAEAEPL